VVFVPRTAVQVVGAESIVYVASPDQHGRFIEQKVEVGDASGDQVSVLAGIEPGDRVVTDGTFFLRAERERASASAR
jgi:multidrug efflux pump subunit AcrA (membrane-fusion protein)